MSDLEDDFCSRGLAGGLNRLGRSATYSRDGEDDVSLTVLCGPEEIEIEDRPNGRTHRRVMVATVSDDPAGPFAGVAALGRNPRMTVGGVEWVVEDRQRSGAGVVRLRLIRAETEDRGRPGLRTRANQ